MPPRDLAAAEQLIDELVPIAARLVGTVQDYGPGDVAAVLARVPDGRYDALAVVLAAMFDPDSNAAQLLAWTDLTLPQRTEYLRLRDAGVRADIAGVLASGRAA